MCNVLLCPFFLFAPAQTPRMEKYAQSSALAPHVGRIAKLIES